MTYNPGMEAARVKVHKGYAQMVREALRLSGKPMSLWSIATATGLKVEKVKLIISGLMGAGGSGGISRERGTNGVIYYTTFKPQERPRESGRAAGRITIGRGMRWWAGSA